MLKLFLYSPSSGLFSCPLAMTDGAAKTIEAASLNLSDAFTRLTSRDPKVFWTSGQWMTERGGGSDVAGGTDTRAVLDNTDSGQQQHMYRLYGYKWFSSATDSDMTLTLGRVVDEQGNVCAGTKGLSMFYLLTRLENTNQLNGIQIVKLKDKLGTRQLPTAELLLDGALAQRVSPLGRGVAAISSMLTVTRMHNIVSSVAWIRKMTLLARDYATKRKAFGKTLDQHPLHMQVRIG
jgi:alkylation response protein AidB-like acyl-CoA dehydrogenase